MSFHHFPDLPIELRIQIWTLALIDQPILDHSLRADISLLLHKPASHTLTSDNFLLFSQRAARYTPAAHLSTCRESRSLITTSYRAFPRACKSCTNDGSDRDLMISCMRKSNVWAHPIHDDSSCDASGRQSWRGWVKERKCIFEGEKMCMHTAPYDMRGLLVDALGLGRSKVERDRLRTGRFEGVGL